MFYIITATLTALGGIMGLILWFIIWHRNRLSSIPLNHLILIAFLVGITCRIAFVLMTPTFYAPDEQSHFNYIKYLYENQSLPVQVSKTDAVTNDWEYYQPPIYYTISVPIYWLVYNILGNNDNILIVRTLRLLSIFFWGVNLFFTLKILNNLNVTDRFIKVFVVSMVCLLPTYTFLSSSINNDNLLFGIGGMILYLLSSKSFYNKSWLVGILLGTALLTKLTAIVYVFTIIGMLVAQVTRISVPLFKAILHLCLILILATILCLPWILRNLTVYGSIYPEAVANVPVQWTSIFHAFIVTQKTIKDTFWSTSGIHNNIKFLPTIGVHLTYFALIGLAYSMFSRTKSIYHYFQGDRGNFLIGSAVAIILNLILTFRFGILYNQGQGRFLFTLLIPISLFLAMGIKSLDIPKYLKDAHIHTVGFFVVYVLSFVGYTFGFFMRL